MTIKSIEELQNERPKIDLTGPKGNAFYLLGYAESLSGQLNKDYKSISKRMKSGDYDNLVAVFEEEFGEFVTLYR